MDTSIVCTPGEVLEAFSGGEACDLTYEDVAHYEDDDDPDRPDLLYGFGMRLSESMPFEFWTYFDRFVRYWPRKTFHVKYAYTSGFVERKRRHTNQSLPLFESLAVEMIERHLLADHWAMWKKRQGRTDPIWLALHMPKRTTVDCIDIDAKKYLLGFYRDGPSKTSRLMPVVHLPLEHFKLLKRVYDHFPGRVWCISSETLGLHAWKKHPSPMPSLVLHRENKQRLSAIGLGHIEAHPMPGRCLRRPFGADYRTITPNGVLTCWAQQLDFFETDERTPAFRTVCTEMVRAMYEQWRSWERASEVCGPKREKIRCRRDVLEAHWHELREVADWLKAGCAVEEPAHSEPGAEVVDPTVRLCREVLTDTLGEKPADAVDPILLLCRDVLLVTLGEKDHVSVDLDLLSDHPPRPLQPALRRPAATKPDALAPMRNGNWGKELLRLARVGLEREDSVGMVVHEMAKWLWWVELHSLPEGSRRAEITRLLSSFVLTKHNRCVSRLNSGLREDVVQQVSRCVESAAKLSDTAALELLGRVRKKWSVGAYKHPVRLVPVLVGQEDVSPSSPCQLTAMCIILETPLPLEIQAKINAVAGRNKVIPFATRLLNRLYNKKGKACLGRSALSALLGYKNPAQIGKYVGILERAAVITRGSSYSKGRNGKLFALAEDVISAMRQHHGGLAKQG